MSGSATATDGASGPGGATEDDDATGTGDEGGIKFDLDPGDTDGTNQTLGCSADLKRVINPDSGLVVEVCPPDQGCLEGQCVPACDAAAGAQEGCEGVRMAGATGRTILGVMRGLVPRIHALTAFRRRKTWMAGTSPAMTT